MARNHIKVQSAQAVRPVGLKNSVRPSEDSDGNVSFDALLITDPR